MRTAIAHSKLPDPNQDVFSKNVLGFWIYLMTDCLIFATLFTAFAVLHSSTFGGPSSRDLFSLSTAFTETMVLLTSSFTCGLAILASYRNGRGTTLLWFALTFLLGITFVTLELNEFTRFVHEGNSWQRSAFLSSFFTLVGTHGFHVSVGLLWLLVLMAQLIVQGFTPTTFRRMICFSMFWHFLDLVWVFIFTFVYILGVV